MKLTKSVKEEILSGVLINKFSKKQDEAQKIVDEYCYKIIENFYPKET